jgi:hypothetical protein
MNLKHSNGRNGRMMADSSRESEQQGISSYRSFADCLVRNRDVAPEANPN